MIELAKRAVVCKGWRWMPGMLSRCSTDTRRAVYRWLVDLRLEPAMRGLDTRHYGLVCIVQDKHGRPCRNVATLQPGPDDLPDLSDPATLGCLLALVREAWGPDTHLRLWASPAPDMSGKDRSKWEPVDGLGRRLVAGPRVLCATEAEALVAALEAAPEDKSSELRMSPRALQ